MSDTTSPKLFWLVVDWHVMTELDQKKCDLHRCVCSSEERMNMCHVVHVRRAEHVRIAERSKTAKVREEKSTHTKTRLREKNSCVLFGIALVRVPTSGHDVFSMREKSGCCGVIAAAAVVCAVGFVVAAAADFGADADASVALAQWLLLLFVNERVGAVAVDVPARAKTLDVHAVAVHVFYRNIYFNKYIYIYIYIFVILGR